MNNRILKLLTFLLLITSATSSADELLHEKLFKRGNGANSYVAGYDDNVMLNQVRSAYIKSLSNKVRSKNFATLMQKAKVAKFKGKRIRFSAYVKAENVKGKAGVWFRVNGRPTEGRNRNTDYRSIKSQLKPNGAILAFDNMQNRPITGTKDWTKYSVVLDVSKWGEYMSFGVMLKGSGQIWFNDFQIEIVGDDVPVTTTYVNRNNR